MNKLNVLFLTLIFSIVFTACDDHVHDHEDHFEAAGYVIKHNEEVIFKVHKGQVDKSIADAFVINIEDGEEEYDVSFLDEDGHDIGTPTEHDDDHGPLAGPDDDEFQLKFEIKNPDLIKYDVHGWELEIEGVATGNSEFRIMIFHDNHADFTSPYVPIIVK